MSTSTKTREFLRNNGWSLSGVLPRRGRLERQVRASRQGHPPRRRDVFPKNDSSRNWSKIAASDGLSGRSRTMKKSKFSGEQIAYAIRRVERLKA